MSKKLIALFAFCLAIAILAFCWIRVRIKSSSLQSSPKLADSEREKSEPPTPRPIYLTIRLRPDVSAATLTRLNQVAQPEIVSADSGTPLQSLLAQSYGIATPTLQNLVVDNNPDAFTNDTKPLLVKQTVALPPGPKLLEKTTVTVHFAGTLRQFAQLTVGNNGAKTKSAILDENPHLDGQWDSRLTGTVHLPYVALYSSYIMRTGSISQARAIANKLMSDDPAVLSATASYGFNLIPAWHLASIPSNGGVKLVTPPAKWPFEQLTDKLSTLEVTALPKWALIAIVDTGIAKDTESIFPLWNNLSVGDNHNEGPYSDRCDKDYHGCNFVNHDSPPVDDCEVKDDYHHGTHVAGIVSGRLYAGRDEINHLIRLMILKAADSNANLSSGDINNALIYAASHSANIVNLSLSGDSTPDITATINELHDILFIAAAGNPPSGVGADLDSPTVGLEIGYPARLAHTHDNVISVAASDPQGNLSSFSDYGNESVDLVAPGEQIPSLVNVGEQRSYNGTSQATALVTLAAGLLYSQGIQTPRVIKRRLMAATDYNPRLRGKVVSEGELNIAKSLEFTHDLVQFKDGHVEAGELKTPTVLSVNYDGYPVTVRLRENLYKIVPHYSNEQGKEIRVTFLHDGKLVYGYISHLGSIRFITQGKGRDISPDEMVDVIPRLNGAGDDHP